MLKTIIDYAEIWAIFIPLIVLARHRKQPDYVKPIIWYLWLALLLNIACDLISFLAIRFRNPEEHKWWYSNTVIYNIHSIVRFALFSAFFLRLREFGRKWIWYASVVFIVATIVIELFSDDSIFNTKLINSSLFLTESFILLLLCMAYYLKAIRSSEVKLGKQKSFWIVTGIAIYCVVNFFVFLFYKPFVLELSPLAHGVWRLHNVAFVIWSIFTAIALYVSVRDFD